jgi:hypothetical protein
MRQASPVLREPHFPIYFMNQSKSQRLFLKLQAFWDADGARGLVGLPELVSPGPEKQFSRKPAPDESKIGLLVQRRGL